MNQRVRLVKRENLTAVQYNQLHQLGSCDEHAFDRGAITNWKEYAGTVLVIVLRVSGLPIGLISASGPQGEMDVAWWVASHYRQKGFAREAIDLLAAYLKRQGVSGIRPITVDTYRGAHNAASAALVRRLKRHFNEGEEAKPL
jgi:RimJ/RimL family protein N-acetyltransferase